MTPANPSRQFNIRVDSLAQVERWRAAAKREKRSLADWVRLTLDAAAEEDDGSGLILEAGAKLGKRRK